MGPGVTLRPILASEEAWLGHLAMERRLICADSETQDQSIIIRGRVSGGMKANCGSLVSDNRGSRSLVAWRPFVGGGAPPKCQSHAKLLVQSLLYSS